jgi:hypothetical protein
VTVAPGALASTFLTSEEFRRPNVGLRRMTATITYTDDRTLARQTLG